MFYKGVAFLSNCRNEGWRWGVGHEIVTAGKKQRIKQRGGVGESYWHEKENIHKKARRVGWFLIEAMNFNFGLAWQYQLFTSNVSPKDYTMYLSQWKLWNRRGRGWVKGSDRSSFPIVDQKYFSKITKCICPPKVTVLSRKLLFSHPPERIQTQCHNRHSEMWNHCLKT